MKIILRTIAILAAAMAVVGLTFAFGNSTFGQALSTRGSDREEFAQREGHVRPTLPEGQFPQGRTHGSARDGGGSEGRESYNASLGGLADVAKSLVKLALIIALVVFGGRLLHWGRGDTSHRRPPETGTAPPA
ncbi:MAG: hypothetical protein WCG26_03505 [Chloroflexales bacterium]